MPVLPGNLINNSWNEILELYNGVGIDSFEETVSLATAAANFTLTNQLPLGAIPLLAQILPSGTISATTAVKIGLGISGTPSKYVLSADLTGTAAGGLIASTTPLAAAETLRISACATGGTAAGTIGGTGQSVKVRVTYLLPLTLK